nr:hypothetical protein [Tanacetum cinerariifolium]
MGASMKMETLSLVTAGSSVLSYFPILSTMNTVFSGTIGIITNQPMILATVDGIQRTESSLRLKLRNEDGIVSIPDTELFENLTLMGIAQSSALPTVADEPASPVRDVSEGE